MRAMIVLAVVGLAACSSDESIEPANYSLREYINTKPTSMPATLAWNDAERGGAAIRQESYYHVVGRQNVSDLKDVSPDSTLPLTPEASIQRSTKVVSYSIYEMQRWERFCGHGKMNSKDWDFVASEGRENIPYHLIAECTAPTYTRQDYIDAWTASCHGGKPTPAQTIIRNSSIPPKNNCKS